MNTHRFLLDTNVCILAIDGHEPDASFVKTAIKHGAVVLSVITIAEFMAKACAPEKKAFEKLARAFPILPIEESTARSAGMYRKKFLSSSRTKLLDCFLASQAKQHGLTLITNNLEDFPMKDIAVYPPRKSNFEKY